MKHLVFGLVIGFIFVLGSIKVSNELKMTVAYDRQVLALERIARAVESMK